MTASQHERNIAPMLLTTRHAIVALGSNLDFGEFSPKTIISNAAKALEASGFVLTRVSPLYQTPCFPTGAGPDYLNAAALVTLRHNETPQQILAVLHRIEAEFGRERLSRWAGRTLDIDLLAVDGAILPDRETYLHWQGLAPEDQARLAPNQLILPHPRLQDRAFVLVPLADVAAEWRHPVLGKSVAEMLAALPAQDRAAVRRLADPVAT
ncbi:MAG: 2-amino-4-hydroxy-6-hydroxymethyldihydropteridine diphosphokinase [Cypionkella sp.]|jgi:2-amino-4-hydroxy-6-hydroxymethyldihydropteridine diphosphokinase